MFNVDSTSVTRGDKFEIKKKCVKYKIPKHFFRIQVVNDWDSLLSGVANAVSLDSFKTKIINDMVCQKVKILNFHKFFTWKFKQFLKNEKS